MQPYIIKRVFFSTARTKSLLYVFAGQGTQEKGMLNQLLEIPQAKQQIENYSSLLNYDFIEINKTDTNNLMNKTKITQPLLVLSQVLRFKYLNPQGLIKDDYMIGHSIGEYSALCIAESISLGQCLKLVSKRGQLMETHTQQPSGMLIVRFSDQNKEKVNNIIAQSDLSIACFNTPNNVNVAGPLTKLEKVRAQFKSNKITCLFLPVSAAFHCKMLAGMVQPFKKYLQGINFKEPKAKVLRNLDNEVYTSNMSIKFGLLEHLTHPVQFWQSVAKVDPSLQCIQIGHNQIVRKFVQETRKKIKC